MEPQTPAGHQMKIIDSHQHFWQFDPVRDSWITDDMKVLQRDFLPHDLAPLLAANNVAGCVVVQADQSEAENLLQLGFAAENDFIKGVVGWVDLRSEGLAERLEYYRGFKKMKGFRHILQGEAQRDLMLTSEFKRGISQLKRFSFTYDILIYRDQLPFAAELVRQFPDQPFVIDHLAKPNIREGEIDAWRKDIMAFAELENVCCKISGMVTEADWLNWKPEDLHPYMDVVVETFGPDRIMYGSDWPVCLVAASYQTTLKVVRDYFAPFSVAEQENFFALNARRFYNL